MKKVGNIRESKVNDGIKKKWLNVLSFVKKWNDSILLRRTKKEYDSTFLGRREYYINKSLIHNLYVEYKSKVIYFYLSIYKNNQ